MALVQSTLSSQLTSNMVPVESEAEGIQNFVNSWEAYFTGASVSGVPIQPAALAAAKAAMQGSMTGVGNEDQAAAIITSALGQFWSTLQGLAATAWVVPPNTVASLTPPPTLSSLQTLLQQVFDNNVQSELEASDCCNAIATVLHANAGIGAIALVTPPSGPPVPTPIL